MQLHQVGMPTFALRLSAKRLFILGLVSVFIALGLFVGWHVTHAFAATQASFYVSPTGSNSNSGTDSSHPFATLDYARQQVAALSSNMTGDIIINLLPGTYTQTQTLAFTQSDSGTNGYNIIYQANGFGTASPAQVTISGGQAITGWSQVSGTSIWQATVGTSLQTRQLYVNGVRATRATGALPVTLTRTGTTGYTASAATLASWGNPAALEFVYTAGAGTPNAQWTESRCGVASISGTAITMQQPCFTNGVNKNSGQQGINLPTSIENAYELLDQPGEWYLNHTTGVLYYLPRSGENLATATVIAPTVETLVSGTGASGAQIHNIHFKGITFAYATWLRPSTGDGFIELQANFTYVGTANTLTKTPANVAFAHAHDLRFERDTFTHLGAAGLNIDTGSQNNTVIGNVFTDISGSGVQLGNVDTPNATGTDQDTGDIVTDNYVHDLPAEYHGGIGIYSGYVASTIISHNEIFNTPYSGISNGWGWGVVSYAQNNQILDNLIYNHMQLLVDGGGIYSNSVQGTSLANGELIDGNVVHDQAHNYGAIYLDNKSQYVTVTNNLTYQTPYNIFQNDNLTPNTVQSNYTDPATAPTAIVSNAGIEAAYADIKGAANVALSKTASATSTYNSSYDATKANDGSTSTGWSPTGTDTLPSWQVDLGRTYTLSQIQLVTRQDMDQSATRQNFAVWASNDATFATHVVLGSQGSSPLAYQATWTQNVTDSTGYRYVRATKTANEYFFITELRVFGQIPVDANVAVGKTAAASSTYSTDYSAAKANDGSNATGWSPTGADTSPWWQVDLGQAYTLSQIKLVTRQDMDQSVTRQNFAIWASNNADMSQGHVVLCSQGSTPLAYQATFTCAVTDTTAYRYVAAVKTANEYFFITELQVFGH